MSGMDAKEDLSKPFVEQTSAPFITRSIFSHNFLAERLPKDSRWTSHDEQNLEALGRMTELLSKVRPSEKDQYRRNEANLEKDFIRPVLEILGHSYDVQESIHIKYRGAERPDYTLFPSEEIRRAVEEDPGEYLASVIGLAEAKAWDLDLDKTSRIAQGKYANPSLQINNYLRDANIAWGILTNGRKWRLYNKETSLSLDSYYEVDIEQLVGSGDLEKFKYFYLFFRKEAFVRGTDQPSFLDDVFTGSIQFARELEEDVKENVYEALGLLIRGFLAHPDNQLRSTDLKAIHDNSLILLYRLLFILYSEAKELLPTNNPHHRAVSLRHLREDIKKELDKAIPTLNPSGDSVWAKLVFLFRLVNMGSDARNIGRNQFFIPPYNGGLFDPAKHPFLENAKIGDKSLAEAVHKLSWSFGRNGHPAGFIDYTTLSIRHLGSIYEGLLEYEPVVAEEDLVVVKERGREVFKKASELIGIETRSLIRISKGELYLRTNKGERKATGSYYTPDFIVKYIVEGTLGPLVDELRHRGLKGMDLVRAVLSLRVLDPAMGSGHFPVEATSFLAARIVESLAEEPKTIEGISEAEVLWARREVARHCIYGVDVNPLAVELAKVSLWLHTLTVDKPLSFLDHHLKCGNSLVGSKIVDLAWLPLERPKDTLGHLDKPLGLVQKILDRLKDLDAISDETVEDVKRKEHMFQQLRESEEYQRIKALSDLHTGLFFVQQDFAAIRKGYMDIVNEAYYGDAKKWQFKFGISWAQQPTREGIERRSFHWELEFPDVFFGDVDGKTTRGFDAVIGNPPYVRIYRGQIAEEDIGYYTKAFKTAHMKFDLYVLFVELGLDLLKPGGRFGMIIPDKWMSSPYGEPLRKKILGMRFESILDLRGSRIFDGVAVENVIPIIAKVWAEEGDSVQIMKGRSPQTGSVEFGFLADVLADVKQASFKGLPQSQIRLGAFGASAGLIQKIDGASIPLGRICYVNWGLRTGTEEKTREMIGDKALGPNYKRLIRGEDINDRYSMIVPNRFLDYDVARLYNPMFPEFFENPKLVFRKISGRRGLLAALDDSGSYGFSTVIIALRHVSLEGVKRSGVIPPTPESKQYQKLGYLLSIVNSRLMIWYYNVLLSDKLSVVPNHVKNLPIHRISFGMRTREKTDLLEKGIKLYRLHLEGGSLSVWHEYLLDMLSVSGESEVVHDLLAYLAEQMTVMHREKNNSRSAFIAWMESPVGLGIKVDELSNKTKILEFHTSSHISSVDACGEIERVLAENHVRLGNEQLSRLREEYAKAASTIAPLIDNISRTDLIIDLAVYCLYGLTPDEIAVVEKCSSDEAKHKYAF
jgi:type I restriction-modification system DNA methylase subunit